MTSSSSNFCENCFFVIYKSRQNFWGTGSHTLGMKNSRPLRTGHDVINGPQMGQKLTNSNVWRPGSDLQWSWGSKNPEVEISQGPKASCALLDICTNFGLKWWKTGIFPRLWRHNVSKIKNFPKNFHVQRFFTARHARIGHYDPGSRTFLISQILTSGAGSDVIDHPWWHPV